MSLSDINSGSSSGFSGSSSSSSHRFGSSHSGSSSYASNSAYDSSSSLYDRHVGTSLADRDHHLRYEPEDYSSSVYGSSSSHRLQDHEKYRLEDRHRTHTIPIPVTHYPSSLYEQSHLQASELHSAGHSVPLVQFAAPSPATRYSDEYIRAREEVRHNPKVVTSVYPGSYTLYPIPYSSSSSSSSSSSRQHLGKMLMLLSFLENPSNEFFSLSQSRCQLSISFQFELWFISGTG